MKHLSGSYKLIKGGDARLGSKAGRTIYRSDVNGELFWSKVKKTDDDTCWLWTANTNGKGYGYFHLHTHNQTRLAHRCAYALEYGVAEAGLVVMHTCDTPLCVRPSHLRLGTVAENRRDMVSKGRQRVGERLREAACWHHGVANASECALCALESQRSALTARIDAMLATQAAFAQKLQARLPVDCPRDTDAIAAVVGRNRAILFCTHFGIGGFGPMRMSELARAADVSRERIRQIIETCLVRLAKHSPRGVAA